jgi:hypothetical protein
MIRYIVVACNRTALATGECFDRNNQVFYPVMNTDEEMYGTSELNRSGWHKEGIYFFDTKEEAEAFAKALVSYRSSDEIFVSEITKSVVATVTPVSRDVNENGILPEGE